MELTWFDEIPNVKFVTLEGTELEIDFNDWETIIHAISVHTS